MSAFSRFSNVLGVAFIDVWVPVPVYNELDGYGGAFSSK